jgi:hypothetical protein
MLNKISFLFRELLIGFLSDSCAKIPLTIFIGAAQHLHARAGN